MKYICNDCGRIIDEDELIEVEINTTEFWGFPCSEYASGCPHCKSDAIKEYEEREEDDG
jgi:predicted Zn-ribbon and HTH transcriptional regulator